MVTKSIELQKVIQSLGNLQFKGICTITSYTVDDFGELHYKGKEVHENIVTRRAIELLFSNNPVFTDARRVAISANSFTPTYGQVDLTGISAIGDHAFFAPNDYVFTKAVEGVNPNIITYQARFPAPATQRDYNSVGIVDGTTDNDLTNATRDCYAYLTLPTTKTQQDNEIDDITYQISISWTNPSINLNPYYQDQYERQFLGQITEGIGYDDYANVTVQLNSENPDFDLRYPPIIGGSGVTATDRLDYLKKEFEVTINNFSTNFKYYGVVCGRLERQFGDRFKGSAVHIPYKVASDLSRVYSHNNSSNSLWDDSNSYANSSWKPIITDISTSRDQLATLYRIKAKTSGGPGTGGSYIIEKTHYSGGVSGFTWAQRPYPLVITSKHPYLWDDSESIAYNAKWIYPWVSDTQWISANKTTVGIWKISPKFELLESVDLFASNGVLDINDLAVNEARNKIYVASEQGLYEIDKTGATTINVLSTDAAKAVDVSFGEEVFAVLVDGVGTGRLSSSIIGFTNAHSFTGTIDYSKVMFIRCDRQSPAHNMGIMEYRFDPYAPALSASIPTNDYLAKIHWWNNSTGYDSTLDCTSQSTQTSWYHPSITHPSSSSFVVEDGIWLYPKFFTAATTTSSNIFGFRRNEAEALEAGGGNVIEDDGESVNVTLNVNDRFQPGASQYNNEIGGSTYVSNKAFIYITPNFAILNTDISSDRLSFACGGYNGFPASTQGYTSNDLDETGGCFDLNVNATSPLTDYTFYENESNVNIYNFTHRLSGSGTSALYYFGGNIQKLKTGGLISFNDNAISRTNYAWGGNSNFSNTFNQPLMISTWGAPTIASLDYPGWSIRYGWNDTLGQWEEDPLGLLSGRPMHTSTENLIDDLQISWEDQAPLRVPPQPTQDLIANESYTFTLIPGGEGFASDGTYNTGFIAKWAFYFRPIERPSYTDTVPAVSPYELTVSEAGSDPLWLSLDPFDGKVTKLLIDGVKATTILTGSPAAGEVLIKDAKLGIFEFNSADANKAVTGEFLYMKKIHPTEVLP